MSWINGPLDPRVRNTRTASVADDAEHHARITEHLKQQTELLEKQERLHAAIRDHAEANAKPHEDILNATRETMIINKGLGTY